MLTTRRVGLVGLSAALWINAGLASDASEGAATAWSVFEGCKAAVALTKGTEPYTEARARQGLSCELWLQGYLSGVNTAFAMRAMLDSRSHKEGAARLNDPNYWGPLCFASQVKANQEIYERPAELLVDYVTKHPELLAGAPLAMVNGAFAKIAKCPYSE